MCDIHSTRRCPHGLLFDDYCEECEFAEEQEALADDADREMFGEGSYGDFGHK
jgi:hypothetical protein